MAPSNGTVGHVVPHEAVAFTVPNTDPPQFYGGCSAGDFYASTQHMTKADAEADVKAHISEMQPV